MGLFGCRCRFGSAPLACALRGVLAALALGLPAAAEDDPAENGEVAVPVGAVATSEDPANPQTARDPILDFLHHTQHQDGSWGDDPLGTDSRAAATALAVLACCHAGFGPEHAHRYSHMLWRGVHALLALDRGDATWSRDDTIQAQVCDALCTCLHGLADADQEEGARTDPDDTLDPEARVPVQTALAALLKPRCAAAIQALLHRRTTLTEGVSAWCGTHPGSCDTDTMLWCLAAVASAVDTQLIPEDAGTSAWFTAAISSANDGPHAHGEQAPSADPAVRPLRFPATVIVVGSHLRASRANATAEGIICGVLLNLPSHLPVMRGLVHQLRHEPLAYDALDCLCRSFCIVNIPGQAGSAGALEELLGARRSLDADTVHSWPSDGIRHGVADDRIMTTCLVSLMRDVAGTAGDWHP